MALPNLGAPALPANAASPEVVVNTNDDLLDHAINSHLTINFASDADLTLSTTGAYPRQWQNRFINITDTSVFLTTARNVIVPVNEKNTVFKNSTAQTLTIKPAAGTGVAITAGSVTQVQCDGTNVINADGGGGSFLNSIVEDATPQLGGDLSANGHQVQWSKGADVASATALPVLTDGNYFDVTGTTTITSINSTAIGTAIKLHFDGVLTLTHNAADLFLPGGVDIITAAGDEAEFIEYAAGDYRCVNYQRASGLPVVGAGSTDADAVHLSVGGEIAALTTVTPAGGDYVLIEDVSDSNNKKKVLVSGLTGTSGADLDTANTWTKGQRGEVTALTDGATITPDFADSNFFSVTLAGNRTLANPTSLVAGQSGSVFITQDATGSRSLAYGSYWDFAGGTAPTLSTAANTVDRLDYLVRASTSIHAVLTKAWA